MNRAAHTFPDLGFAVRDVGRMAYLPCWDLQRVLAAEVAEERTKETLIFVEHDPVLTLGANFHAENLLHPVGWYRERGIDIVPTDRGGDVTYHGPGQLVIYPIFRVDRHGRDLHRWLRDLEEAMLRTCAAFDLTGRRFPPHTGVWIGDRKVAAIGIKVRKWVNLHGIALNCANPLDVYDEFVPCGIRDYGVTSLSEATGTRMTLEDVKPCVIHSFESVFFKRE
jgi:lipoate-protein ligase B